MFNITSPGLVHAIRRVIHLSLFESVQDGVLVEEPYASLFHFLPDMRSDMIGRATDSKELDDIEALEYFLYECQPRNKSLQDSLNLGHQALVNFETLWALFKAGDKIMIIDKFEEKRLFKFTHIEEKISEVGLNRQLCTGLEIWGWCIVWDIEQKSFTQRSYSFLIETFAGHRKVKSLPVYPLRYEDDETKEATISQLQKRGRSYANLISSTPSCFEYYGRALEVGHRFGDESKDFAQVSSNLHQFVRDELC
jgi:hypothetical protein